MSYILQALKKSEQERDIHEKKSSKEQEIVCSVYAGNEENSPSAVNGVIKASFFSIYKTTGLFVFLALLILVGYAYQTGIDQQMYTEEVDSRVDLAESLFKKDAAVSKVTLEKIIEKDAKPTRSNAMSKTKILVDEAPENITSLLPEIIVSSHIYSTLPVRRSIVVNGERLTEGDFVAPEVQVKEITQQGMVLNIKGWLLIVDRSRGWSR